MPMLDIFNSDAFNYVSLSTALNMMPYKPKRLGELGLFMPKPIRTTTAVVEEKHGKLSVLQTQARGTMPQVDRQRARLVRSFTVPYIPINSRVMADDVQNVRTFGSETEMEAVSSIVNEHLENARNDHETTWEWHRMGALKGDILDADGTSILNLFTAFGGLTQTVIDFELSTATTEVKTKCTQVQRAMDDALGGDGYSEIRVFCGNTFWDELVSHPTVKEAYDRWQDGAFLRNNQYREGFPFGGLFFENYRGKIGGTQWVDDKEAHCAALGVRGLFVHHMAPAPFIETVNTNGQAMYAKQKRLEFDTGIEIHTNSCPLIMCTRPQTLIKLTTP